MKKIVQWVRDAGYEPGFIDGWKKWSDKFVILDSFADADPEVPMVLGANLVNKYHRDWLKAKRPAFVMNRQLTGMWKEKHRTIHRVAVNSYGSTQIGNMSHSRWPILDLDKQPWKVSTIKNVLIAPPKKSISFWTGFSAEDWAVPIRKRLESEGANVRFRGKQQKRHVRYSSLWEDFDWADLIISYSSGITAEAFWYGKKVISLGVCPTWTTCEKTLDNWQNPIEPAGRDIWHEHISWIQFKYAEWESGDAQEMTLQYQGWPTEVSYPDNPFVEENP